MPDKNKIIKEIIDHAKRLSGKRYWIAEGEIVESLMQVPIEILMKRRDEIKIFTKEQYSVLVLPSIELTLLKITAMTSNLN